MDFNDTPEQESYRSEVRAWLSANAEPRRDRPSVSRRLDVDEGLALAKAWQAKRASAGYACRHWPVQHGGKNRPMIETIIVEVPNESHPYGVRGVGEVPIVPPPAAIANAIYDATGVRMRDLPMSPPRVQASLAKNGS